MFIPPLDGAIDLGLRALGDADFHGKLAVTTREFGENLFDRNCIPAISLGN